MNRFFLTRVAIEGFRGVNNDGDPLILTFKSNAVNSVFGPNGLGKSSVFDALAYAFTGAIPKFAELPASDSPADYYANKFHSTQTSKIELTFVPESGGAAIEIHVERLSAGSRTVTSPTGEPNPEAFLRQFGTGTCLLDYRTFSQFVDDTPLKRGRTFSGLLGLGKLSEYRQVLEALANAKALKGDFELDLLEYRLQTNTTKAGDALARAAVRYETLIGVKWSQPFNADQVAEAASTTLKGIGVIGSLVTGKFVDLPFAKLREAIKTAEGSAKRDRLAEVIRKHDTLEQLGAGEAEPGEQARLLDKLKRRDSALESAGGSEARDLYAAAQVVLNQPEWVHSRDCPLCETKNLSSPLAEHVEHHLKAYGLAQQSEKEARELWKASSWVERCRKLETVLRSGPVGGFTALNQRFTVGSLSQADLSEGKELLATLDSERAGELDKLKSEKDALEKELPPSLVAVTEQVERAEQLRDALKEHQEASALAIDTSGVLAARKRWATFIGTAAEQFAKAEVALSTSLTVALENDYRALYEAVTRNPEIVPRLKKAPGSEELFLRLEKFFGLSDVSAATLLPESYRNALAICIFLAASQSKKEPARFIVLDDITSSFDNGHQFHLMELLRTSLATPANPKGPQIILLSHDGSLEKYFDTAGNGTDWHHQKLQGAPPRGTVLTQAQDGQRLRKTAEKFLNAGQIAEASPLIRQYLEYSLLKVIRQVAIPVPIDFVIRDDRKMVENCLNAINHAVDLHSRAGDLILSATQTNDLDKVLVPKLMGNLINHYATGTTTSISPYVLLGVLDDIDKLVECFKHACTCVGGGAGTRFYKSLSEKHCAC